MRLVLDRACPARRWFMILLAAATASRLLFFFYGLRQMPPSTDEVWSALMGWHVWQGEFPVFYWGQPYMGAHSAYFHALLIPWLGLTTAAVRLYPLLCSFLFLAVSYQLACAAYGRAAGLVTLALLALPPAYLAMSGALAVPPEYLSLAVLGSLALLLLTRIVRAPGPPAAGPVALLGGTLGLACWLHLVAYSYLGVALLFLWLKDKLIFIRRAFWLGLLGFALGSLPFWAYNLAHDFETFRAVGQTVDWRRSLLLLQAAGGYTLHFLVGLKVMLYGDSRHYISLPPWLAVLMGLALVGSLAALLATRARSLARLARLSLAGADGTGILLALLAAALFLFCRGARASWSSPRFLFPVLSVLPVLVAGGLAQIRRWSRPLFAAALGAIIGCQAWGAGLLWHAWHDPQLVAETLALPPTGKLRRFLASQGLRHACAHLWLSYRLTFEMREALICAEPYNMRFPGRPARYLDQVRAAPRMAFITHPALPFTGHDFEALLRQIGGSFRRQQVEGFTVFYDFTPPYGRRRLREIPRGRWQVSANCHPADAARAIDGQTGTVWTTRAPQAAGQWLQADLGQPETVCAIRMDLGSEVTHYPRGYRLDVSLDGTRWQPVGQIGDLGVNLFWEGRQPRFLVGGDYFYGAFAPVRARFLKLTLVPEYQSVSCWWTVAELRAFGPEPEPAGAGPAADQARQPPSLFSHFRKCGSGWFSKKHAPAA